VARKSTRGPNPGGGRGAGIDRQPRWTPGTWKTRAGRTDAHAGRETDQASDRVPSASPSKTGRCVRHPASL